MNSSYHTRFGSLADYEKGRVEPIADDVKNYAFSNCFEIANRSKPFERVVFAQNQVYVLEVVRAEGTSAWYTCAHDEFALCMDGEVTVRLMKPGSDQVIRDAEKLGAVTLAGQPTGPAMGWIKLKAGHQGMMPANCAYQISSARPGVLILQTCKGELSLERWAEHCQAS